MPQGKGTYGSQVGRPPKREPTTNTGIYLQIIFPVNPNESAPIPFQNIPTKIKV